MNIKVTIGVCVKNSEEIIRKALDSLVEQNFPRKAMKLVIVDDGSKDNTLSIARDFASETDIETMICSSGGKGLGFSRQIVVDNAQGDYIIWVDGDMVLTKGFVRKNVEFMEKNSRVGAARGNGILGGEKELVATLEFMSCELMKQAMDPNPEGFGVGGSILFALSQVFQKLHNWYKHKFDKVKFHLNESGRNLKALAHFLKGFSSEKANDSFRKFYSKQIFTVHRMLVFAVENLIAAEAASLDKKKNRAIYNWLLSEQNGLFEDVNLLSDILESMFSKEDKIKEANDILQKQIRPVVDRIDVSLSRFSDDY